jgi:hypothetical protein
MVAKKKPLTAKKSNLLIASEMTDAIAKEKDERMTKIAKKIKTITPLEDLKKNGKAYRGKKELIKLMTGGKLSAQECIYAKCYDCMGWYSDDGAVDCESKDCPLYPKMPYNKNKVKSKVVSAETIEKRKKTMESKE